MPMPKLVLMMVCISRYRLMRCAASSSTRVVVISRLYPPSRMTRFLRSSRSISMKITSTMTAPAEPRYST